MKTPHRLQAIVAFEAYRNRQEQGERGEGQPEWNQAACQLSKCGQRATRSDHGEPPQYGQRREDADPLIPGPRRNEKERP